jgi:hypothetical protein
VVESGWNTVDLSAYLIVRNFYRQLLLGRNKGKALRYAKLHFLKETTDAYSHPYLWANFRVYGNNAPVKIALSPRVLWSLGSLGAVAVFMAVVWLWRREKTQRASRRVGSMEHGTKGTGNRKEKQPATKRQRAEGMG